LNKYSLDRGFETVTYMLQGKFQHEDFSGHKGVIGPGDLQVTLLTFILRYILNNILYF
jgi:hypothetical protein